MDSDSDEAGGTTPRGLVCMARPPINTAADATGHEPACGTAATCADTPTPRVSQGDGHPSVDSTPTGLVPPPGPADDHKRPLLQSGSPPYKYQVVVRGKDARAQLTAVDCAECARFWGAMQSWGQGAEKPACTHGNAMPLHALRQEVGRHRYKHVPPATPAGFWEIGFGDSPDAALLKGSRDTLCENTPTTTL